MRKRLLSFVLAVLMIASLLPATALAADIVDSGTCGAEGDGSNLTWTLDSDGVLTISGSGDMYDYGLFDAPWYGIRSLVKSAVIADGVTSIGEKAFLYCTSLTSVTIPDSVTSIDYGAFYNCTSLTSVTIPDSVTSIGYCAFYECTSLTSVTIPDGVTSIGEATFRYCTSLTSVTIPDSVTSIGDSAFDGCVSLTSVTIPDSVTSIGGGAFSNCAALTGIWVAEGNSHYSSDASGVLFSKDKTTLVQCPGTLAECTIPDSVTSIGDWAFAGCTSLTSVTIPDSVTSIGAWAFGNCTSLTSVTIPDGVTSIGEYTFYNCTSLTSVTIPDSVTSIGDSAFDGCVTLTSVTIPDSVTRIGGYAFSGCESLTNVYFTGTEEAWNGITIDDGNDALKNANIHYNYVSHTHSYDAVVTAPTCTDKGYTTHTCSCGDSYVDTYVDALGHAWDEGKATKPATEVEAGIKTYTCTRCGETKTETIPKLTHEHNYKAVVTAPTCTAKGYTTHTCACGDSYVDAYTDALGHAWDSGKVTKQPTATEAGIRTYTCTRCGETKTETISATGCPSAGFTDVPGEDNWAHAGIDYCVANGLMSGIGNDLFRPKLTTTRAQIVQILYNLEGSPKVSGATPFMDLTNDWYQDAVLWAYQTGVVAGTSSTTFEPDRPVTREQIAVILMEYMTRVLKLERTWTPADLSTFPDADSVSDWAKDAMADAVALGLISGASNGGQTLLEPQGSATREQVATILMEFCKNVKK